MYESGFREILSSDHSSFRIRTLVRKGQLDVNSAAPHWHDETELVLSRKGCGIQQIGSSFFPINPGDLAVISSGQPHSFMAVSENEEFDLLVIQFRVEHFLHELEDEKQFCSDWSSGRLLFDHPITADPQLSSLLELINRELTNRKPGSTCAVEGALRLLLFLLYQQNPTRLTASASPLANTRQYSLIDPALTYLAEHYRQEDLSVEQAASAANLSPTHFCRLFKAATGMGFHEYLNRYRIVQAEHLFSSSMNLVEIAYSCGFGSSSSFLRNFKKYRGVSPQAARKQHQ